jgi:hypothetical protein
LLFVVIVTVVVEVQSVQETWQVVEVIYGFGLFPKSLYLLLVLLSFRQRYVQVLKADHRMQIKAHTSLLYVTLLG